MIMLKATLEGDKGEGVMLSMVVHWLALQEMQDCDPGEFEYCPMEQGMQLEAKDVPAWQGTQLIPESEKVPGRQAVQLPFEE